MTLTISIDIFKLGHAMTPAKRFSDGAAIWDQAGLVREDIPGRGRGAMVRASRRSASPASARPPDTTPTGSTISATPRRS